MLLYSRAIVESNDGDVVGIIVTVLLRGSGKIMESSLLFSLIIDMNQSQAERPYRSPNPGFGQTDFGGILRQRGR